MRRTIKKNNLVLREMKKIYFKKELDYVDWMGFKIDDINKPSYHHIVKKEDLKKENKDYDATISNGAYLGKKSHELLHKIEMIDYELYLSWNYLFNVINNMKCYPIDDVIKIRDDLKEKSLKLVNEVKYDKKIK